MACLPAELANQLKKRIVNGEITAQKLVDLGDEGRRKYFTEFLGEDNAKRLNAVLERGLLLKNWKRGLVNALKSATGIKKAVKMDLISRIEKMEKVLNPADETKFLGDLAESKLGFEVTPEEAKQIWEMSKKLQETNAKADPEKTDIPYGNAKVEMGSYLKDLKLEANKKGLQYYKDNPLQIPKEFARFLASNAKSIWSSFDNSFIGMQGISTLYRGTTDPSSALVWAKTFGKSFELLLKQIVAKGKWYGPGEDLTNFVKARIYADPDYRNGTFSKMKLAIGEGEEAFPESFVQNIPLLGRVYQGTQTAFEGSAIYMRYLLAKNIIKRARKNGVDLTDKYQAEGLGQVINSLTGRGSLGQAESAGKVFNIVFFSPKLFKANIDKLFMPFYGKEKISKQARKEASRSTLGIILGIGSTLLIAKALLGDDSVELDPRSSDFGKIKIGDSRINITGGLGSIVTMISRIATASSKSSTTGNVSQLGTGYGQTSGLDVIENFLEGKMAPILSLAKDLYNGKDFDGNPVTIQSTIEKLLTPLPIQNFSDNMQNPNAANLLLLTILDGLGFSTNTYSAKEKTELQKLKDTISKNKSSGEEAFMPRYKEIQAMTPLQQKLARAKLSKKDSALYDAIHKVEATKDTKDLEATQGDKILNLYQEDKKNKNIDNYKKLSAAERKLYNKIKDEAESPFYSDKTTE